MNNTIFHSMIDINYIIIYTSFSYKKKKKINFKN